MPKSATASVLILAIFTVTTTRTQAQEVGTWEKLVIPKPFYTLEVTPYGIYAGEFSGDWSQYPYNGVFVSHDLGATWAPSGLESRGITDIAYNNGKLYATVYYWATDGPPGLYESDDKGASWTKISPDFSAASVAVCANNIMLGGYSHGLWVSGDGGDTWVQKLGDGVYGNDILNISVNGNTAITSDFYTNYVSKDCGITWEILGKDVPAYLSGITVVDTIWLACSGTTGGIYRSTDSGQTFYPVADWSPNPCYAITYYDAIFYTSSHSNYTGYYTVLRSTNKGKTWQDITPENTVSNYVRKLAWLASSPGYIFAISPGTGVYRYKVPPREPETQPFLANLWARTAMSDQTDRITSYFDHTYPLLAYPYKSEPPEEVDTTTNFWGERGKAPDLYYSSHDGIDFGLMYSTPIVAPASGYATYAYTPGGGHTIKIDHQNGYQTQYLHLQKAGLFTNKSDTKWIDEGQQIGLVGMTGNTTGPHLHFAVRYDKNGNGNFLDDVPDGRVDPYSWQDSKHEDPWTTFSWTDGLGNHVGSEGAYLWKDALATSSEYLSKDGGSLTGESATITVPPGALETAVTLNIRKTGSEHTDLANQALKYIRGTALLGEAYDNMHNQISQFTTNLEISFDLSRADFTNIATETLKVMYFDPASMVWNQVATTWNETTKLLTGFVDHLSEFAVFGAKLDANPPVTTLVVSGQKDASWYTESPTISLTATDGANGFGVDKTFYSLDGGDTWEEYITQTQIVKNGIYAILYRSSDEVENYEPTKDSPLLRVDTWGIFKDEVILSGNTFTTAASD